MIFLEQFPVFRNLKIYHPFHRILPMDLAPCQCIPEHKFTTYFYRIGFDIVLPSTLLSSLHVFASKFSSSAFTVVGRCMSHPQGMNGDGLWIWRVTENMFNISSGQPTWGGLQIVGLTWGLTTHNRKIKNSCMTINSYPILIFLIVPQISLETWNKWVSIICFDKENALVLALEGLICLAPTVSTR